MGKLKGFVYTIDVLIAIAILAFFFSPIKMLQTIEPTHPITDLGRISMDALTTLEKTSQLVNATNQNSNSTLNVFLNNLPFPLCGKIELYNSSSSAPFMSSQTANCTAANTTGSAIRTFNYNYNVYYSKMQAWFKEQ